VTFGRVLREAGLEVGPGRIADALTGLDRVGLAGRDDVYWTLRTTLVSRVEDVESFDRAFAAWFLASPRRPVYRVRTRDPSSSLAGDRRVDAPPGGQASGDDPTGVGWSSHEVLRRKDFASMTPEEFAQAARVLAEVARRRPLRRSRRLRPDPRGRSLDLRRLARRSLARGGEPIEQTFRRRVEVAEELAAETGENWSELPLERQDAYFDRAKEKE